MKGGRKRETRRKRGRKGERKVRVEGGKVRVEGGKVEGGKVERGKVEGGKVEGENVEKWQGAGKKGRKERWRKVNVSKTRPYSRHKSILSRPKRESILHGPTDGHTLPESLPRD